MKMSRQNPGGEDKSERYMKGCEKFMDRGKGGVLGGSLQTKKALSAPGLSGMGKGAHVRSTAHAKTSFSGNTVSTTHKAAS